MNIYQILSQNSQQNPFFAFMTGLILFLLGSILLLPIFAFLIAVAFGVDQAAIQDILVGNIIGTHKELAIFRLIQGANQIASWGFAGLVMAYLLGRPKKVLLLNERTPLVLFFPVLIILFSLPLVQGTALNAENFQLPAFMKDLEIWMHQREAQSLEMLMKILAPKDMGALIFNLFIFACLPAICEEFFFRGYLQGLMSRIMNPHAAIILVAFIFSFIHLQFYGFFPRFILGILLGYFVFISGSLYPSMIAHFFFNGMSIIAVQISGSESLISTDINSNTLSIPIYLIIISLMITLVTLIYYSKISSKNVYE